MLPVRSAAPATRPGSDPTVASNVACIAWRVAFDEPSSNVGRSSVHPATPVPLHAACHSGVATTSALRAVHAAWAAAPTVPTCFR